MIREIGLGLFSIAFSLMVLNWATLTLGDLNYIQSAYIFAVCFFISLGIYFMTYSEAGK